MQDRKDERRELNEQEAARRKFLNRLGKAGLGIPATVMLMSVTVAGIPRLALPRRFKKSRRAAVCTPDSRLS